MAELASRKKCAKAALIALAKQRFAEQQSASSHQLVAPISPSPPELIEKTLHELEFRGLLRDNRLVDLGCGDGRWLVAARHGSVGRTAGDVEARLTVRSRWRRRGRRRNGRRVLLEGGGGRVCRCGVGRRLPSTRQRVAHHGACGRR